MKIQFKNCYNCTTEYIVETELGVKGICPNCEHKQFRCPFCGGNMINDGKSGFCLDCKEQIEIYYTTLNILVGSKHRSIINNPFWVMETDEKRWNSILVPIFNHELRLDNKMTHLGQI